MKKLNLLLMVLIISLPAFMPAYGQKIKTAIYWTSPLMSENVVPKIAKFDLAIVDFENAKNNRHSLDSLKKLNPEIKLIAYFNSMEFFDPMVKNRPGQSYWAQEVKTKYPEWLLKTGDGKKAIFYPGMRMLNLTSVCPKINGETYGEWMAKQLVTEFRRDSLLGSRDSLLWDGGFADNCTPTMSWNFPNHVDANNDGQPDDDAIFDISWFTGYMTHLNIIRKEMGKDFIIIGNKGVTEFMNILDGRMFEGWTNNYLGDKTDDGWWQCLVNAHQTGKYTIFQVKENNLDFAVASALLLDNVYIAVGQNNPRWYPQFDLNYEDGEEIVVSRRFKDGKEIKVSPTKRSGEFLNSK